jgi:hypothetical protein
MVSSQIDPSAGEQGTRRLPPIRKLLPLRDWGYPWQMMPVQRRRSQREIRCLFVVNFLADFPNANGSTGFLERIVH